MLRAVLIVSLGWMAVLGCASPRDGSGERVVVRLYDAQNGVRLELANESHPDLQGLYSTQRASASLKLAPEPLLARLLGQLDALRFATLSQPGRAPGAAAGGSLRGWVEVDIDGSPRTFLVDGSAPDVEQLRAFAGMKLAINDVYMRLGSGQFVENPEGAALFRKQP